MVAINQLSQVTVLGHVRQIAIFFRYGYVWPWHYRLELKDARSLRTVEFSENITSRVSKSFRSWKEMMHTFLVADRSRKRIARGFPCAYVFYWPLESLLVVLA